MLGVTLTPSISASNLAGTHCTNIIVNFAIDTMTQMDVQKMIPHVIEELKIYTTLLLQHHC
jgi:hypothetical protein